MGLLNRLKKASKSVTTKLNFFTKPFKVTVNKSAKSQDTSSVSMPKQKRSKSKMVNVDFKPIIDFLIQENKALHKRYKSLSDKLDSIIRSLNDEKISALQTSKDISTHRFQIFSQNEEDGILLSIFSKIGAPNKTFVEIGSGGSGGNSGLLTVDLGWRGIMVEASRIACLKARRRYFGYNVDVVNSFVTTDNINDIITQHNLDGEIDFLSIDIDGNDYWIWDAVNVCNPRVVIMEYNWRYGPTKSVTIPYNSEYNWRDIGLKGYHGASLTAFSKLATKKGYSLILCDPSGTNSFFIRNDLVKYFNKRTPEEAFRIHHKVFLKDLVHENNFDIYDKIKEKNLPLVEID